MLLLDFYWFGVVVNFYYIVFIIFNFCRDKNKVNNKIIGCLLFEWNIWNYLSVLINIIFLIRMWNDI